MILEGSGGSRLSLVLRDRLTASFLVVFLTLIISRVPLLYFVPSTSKMSPATGHFSHMGHLPIRTTVCQEPKRRNNLVTFRHLKAGTHPTSF